MNRRFSRSTPSLAGVLCAALTAAACGANSTSGGKVDDTLDVVALFPPSGLSPLRASITAPGAWYTPLAYDSLIHHGPNGKLEPALATSWKYVGTDKRVFQLTLRSGVKFADGTPMTADSVVKSLRYTLLDPASQSAPYFSKATITAPDAQTVSIELAEPNPELPFQLSSNSHASEIISPQGLASPKALGHSTAGTGRYVLDEAQTVSGDHYTYTPNPNYYNKPAIRYKKIVIKVVSSPNAALSQLKTGAADVVQGDINTADSARSAGFRVNSSLVGETGIVLYDRTGALSKPMGSQLVRQALNYAVDRETIAKSLLHGSGKAVNQVGEPGTPDYLESAAGQYAYDPGKAKSLLAEAGYPEGFSTDMVIFTLNPPASDVAQAVIADWAKIGVKVRAINSSDGTKYAADALSKKYPMISYGYGYIPFFLYSKSFYLPLDSPFNVFKSDDPQLTSLIKKGNAASGDEQRTLYGQATQRVLDLAWLVPVTSFSVLYFTSPKVAGAQIGPGRPLLDLTELSPA